MLANQSESVSIKVKKQSLMFKDRQHRRRGGCTFSFIVHELNGVEYCSIYQMKDIIFLYTLVLNSEWFRAY